jgi:uncharacterized RDD family membrane protein YckC
MSARPTNTYRPLTAEETATRARAIAPRLRRRVTSFVYEGVLVFGIAVPVGLVYGIATNQRHGLEGRHGLWAALLLAFALYYTWCWVQTGQTLAMKTWHLRVVGRDGEGVTLPRALLRHVLAWLWLMPGLLLPKVLGLTQGRQLFAALVGWMVLYAVSSFVLPRRQFLHDVLSGTCLIDTRPDAAPTANPDAVHAA